MLIVMLLAAALVGGGYRAIDPAAEYRQLVAQYQKAFNNGDGVALGELYRSDATLLDPDGTRLVGQTAIRDYFVAGLGGPIKGAKTTLTVLSVRSPTPDVAVGEGTYVFEMAGQPPVRGVWMNVAVRTNGRWRIHSDIGAPAAK